MNAPINQQDPVYMQADGRWCVLTVDRTGFFGPFNTQEEARKVLQDYILWLNSQQPQVQAPVVDTSAVEKATAEYMALRSQKAEINEQHRLASAEVDRQMDLVEAYLLNYLNTSGLKNFAVGDATVYTETQFQASIGDKGALMDFIRQTGMPELLQSRVSSTALKQFIEAGNQVPPGIKVNQERVVRVRSK